MMAADTQSFTRGFPMPPTVRGQSGRRNAPDLDIPLERPEPPMEAYEEAAQMIRETNGVEITGRELYNKWKAIDAVLDNMAYSQTQALIMIGLIARSDKTYANAFPSVQTLSRYAKIRRQETIYAAVRSLEAPPFGVIVKEKVNGRKNTYQVLPERVMNLVISEHEAQKARAAAQPQHVKTKAKARQTSAVNRGIQEELPLPQSGQTSTVKRGLFDPDPIQSGQTTPVEPHWSNAKKPITAPNHSGLPVVNKATPTVHPDTIPFLDTDRSVSVAKNIPPPPPTTVAVAARGDGRGEGKGSALALSPGRPRGSYTRDEHDGMMRALLEAAGDVLDPVAIGLGLQSLEAVEGWIASGADWELDILAALREAVRDGCGGQRPRQWRFFTSRVTSTMRRRKANADADARAFAEMSSIASQELPAPNSAIPSKTSPGASRGGLTPLDEREFTFSQSGALRIHGPFREELAKAYPRANIDAACDLVAGEIARYRRSGAGAEEVKALIRSRVAEEHQANAKAAKWGKREQMPITGNLDAAMRNVFGKKEG